MIQEITSQAVAEAVRDAMGLKGFHVACSDFTPGDKPDFSDFEVAVISRWPLSQVIEYDPSPDASPDKETPQELELEPQLKLGIRRPNEDIRGFLWARVDAVQMTVAVVHLKSSRGTAGPEDYENARKREFVAATVAVGVLDDREFWPEYSCIVGGDFNVGHSDKAKNGRKLFQDASSGTSADGYDDTHALFAEGIVGGLKMKNLVGYTMEPTFPSFPGSPIDNLYVASKRAASFKPAVISQNTFGSDHRPVWTSVDLKVTPDAKLPIVAAGHDTPAKPKPTNFDGVITAEQAPEHVNQHCVVEFTVRGGTMLDGKGLSFLNSKAEFRDADNFTAVIHSSALKAFAQRGMTDPSQSLRNKTVRVTGVIANRNGKCQIEVDDADAIQVVN
jgi:endonuclease/exonuclease/phosphatase family metal-dependent hydrolase